MATPTHRPANASADQPERLTLGQCATLAVLIEATAPKPGNVHRGADFADLAYPDLLVAAVASGPIVDGAAQRRIGQTVLAAVRATQAAVGTNTNLGTLLLLAPLAAVPREVPLPSGVAHVLASLTPDDARDVYQAIGLARPGGLGQVEEADVAGPPPDDLVAAMRLAAERDLVARQYANGFQEVLGEVVPGLASGLAGGWSLCDAVVRVHLQLLARHGDSLIARKCGLAVSRQAADRAADVLAAGALGAEAYQTALADFDFWLRSAGHTRNPGTTADLVAAGLFAALRDGIIPLPLRLAAR